MADIIDLIYEDHDWFRRRFFLLDSCRNDEELAAVWEPLADRLDAHAQAEEEIFYPRLLKEGGEVGDPEDETEDAISDHNEIREAVRASRDAKVGSDEWWKAVTKAREENGEHLEEEEREGMTDFIKSASLEERRDLAMQWVIFFARHRQPYKGVDDSEKDVEEYIEQNS